MGLKTDLSKPDPTDIQWEYNHEKIVDCWEEVLNDTGKRPTMVEIAKRTGFDRSTVKNHILRMKFDTDITPKHLMNLDRALDKLYVVGVEEGDVKALVEYIKLVGNPSKKQEIDKTVTNRTLKVSFTGKDKNNLQKTEEVEFEEVIDE